MVQAADCIGFASPWILNERSGRGGVGGGRCVSLEVRVRAVPQRGVEAPEILVHGDAGRGSEYRVHVTTSE
eukprot:11189382-Lingulodinium_polyedra.AAC.1